MSYPPLYTEQDFQRRQDEEHLRLLSIFHYIYGGLIALGSCVFLVYILMGLVMESAITSAPSSPGSPPPPEGIGTIFAVIGGVALLFGWGIAGLTIYAGVCLARRKSIILVQIMAALSCLNVPVGTVLGVFTFVVLNRPSVRALFDPAAAYAAAQAYQPQEPQNSWYNDYDRRG